MRDRLIELINEAHCVDVWDYHTDDFKEPNPIEELADYLLENGIIVPPCKVGDVVYYLGGIYNRLIKSAIVEEIICNSSGVSDLLVTSENGVTFENSIDIFYITKEEAENALKERERG